MYKNKKIRSLTLYGTAVFLSLLIMTITLRLWNADLTVPFKIDGDALYNGAVIKGMIDNGGWYLRNNFLGAPFGLELYDFQNAYTFFYMIIKVMTLVWHNYAVVMNLFYLISFPLTTATALFVIRRFGVSAPPALAAALLFTFLPYHFLRGEDHLMLSSYYLVPLMIMIVLSVMTGKFSASVSKPFWAAAIVVCLLTASSGIYYAFFTVFFLLVAAVLMIVRLRDLRAAAASIILIAVILLGLVANALPSISYNYHNGRNLETIRKQAESEIYALKISQLLLPVTDHRLAPLNRLKAAYRQAPLVNENDYASLGVIGAAGFLSLLFLVFIRGGKTEDDNLLGSLSDLNLAALLFATVGGFSSLFALLVTAQLRAYNRISIFIAFFALFAAALWADKLRAKLTTTGSRAAFYIVIAFLLVLGILDQTSVAFIPDYVSNRRHMADRARYVRRIEAALPPNAAIFQLPYAPFPESPSILKMKEYDHLSSYLVSRRLRWSYAVMRGRRGDLWQQTVTARPLKRLIDDLVFTGFSGVEVDRFGYIDWKIAAGIERQIAAKPIVSADGRYLFYDLRAYGRRLRVGLGGDELTAREDAARNPLMVDWRDGFFAWENSPRRQWRWSDSEAKLWLINTSKHRREVTITMEVAAGGKGSSRLKISSDSFSDKLRVSVKARKYRRRFQLPPGTLEVLFSSDGAPIEAPGDPRTLVFRVINFKIVESR